MVTMSEDEVQGSDLLKRDMNHYLLAELRTSLKELQDLMRRKKDKDRKSKMAGDTAGGASTLPNYPGNNPKQTTNPTGGTEDETDATRFGLDPRALAGRGSGGTP
tara:strand:+ start:56 stop:370 length:315 start_codon:yes stop_codon:yes gene_type:complete